jgi:hypothetical protein
MCVQSGFCFVVCALGLGKYRNLYKKFFGSVGVKAFSVTQDSTCFSPLSTGLASVRKLAVHLHCGGEWQRTVTSSTVLEWH